MSIDTARPTRTRDGLIDLLRSVSIVRVIVIHLLGRARLSYWPAPTFVMPGMPTVFFVSGSLAYQSLRLVDGVRRSAVTYWRRTLRRLLLPYWAFYAALTVWSVGGDLTHPGPRWNIDYPRLLLGATGLIVPDASRAMRHHTGHMWFMSVFLVLAIFAPAMVRLFERARWVLLAVVLSLFVFVQWLVLEQNWEFDVELEKLTTFAIPYVIGFWYTDGGLKRAGVRALSVAAVVTVAAAWFWNGVEPGAVNGSQTKHLLVGGAWLLLAMIFAPQLRRAATRFSGIIDRITKRTFTVYLWGWATCVFASDWVDEIVAPGWWNRFWMATGSIALLGAVVAIFGRVEDLSARPPKRTA